MIDIAFCINKNFVMPCGVLILSIQYFNKIPITFHVLSNDLDENDKNTLKTLIGNENNCRIKFYQVPDTYNDILVTRDGDRVSKETYYRLFIPDVVGESVHKILYLDCDMICIGSLEELFKIDLMDHPVGMCYDTSYSKISVYNRLEYSFYDGYYNGGTVLMNVDCWRKVNLTGKLIEYLLKNSSKCLWHDQDVVNAVCHGQIYHLHQKFNVHPYCYYVFYWFFGEKNKYLYDETQFLPKEKWNEIVDAVKKPVIIHLYGRIKPWNKESIDPFVCIWRYFYSLSPWKDVKLKKKNKLSMEIKICIRMFFEKIKLIKKRGGDVPYPQEVYDLAEKILCQLVTR